MTSTETRMLERRVSNNRSDLDGDQKINYFISWFTQWSGKRRDQWRIAQGQLKKNVSRLFIDLQKSDFVGVLAEKMSSTVNGVHHDSLDSLSSLNLQGSKRPPSLFECQVKLFREWFSGWSDDQKNYLVSSEATLNFGIRWFILNCCRSWGWKILMLDSLAALRSASQVGEDHRWRKTTLNQGSLRP